MKGDSPEQSPLVSVVMAVYNGRETIEHAIRSVVTQTCSRVEFVIVDGGSTDGTTDLLTRYDDSIDYWISEPDKGIYYALNKGIGFARGEWLYFLGADDELADDEVIETVFSQHHDTNFLYGDVLYGEAVRIYGGEFTKYRLIRENICHQGIFYRAELFKVLGKFDLKYPILSDWVFNMQVFALEGASPEYIHITIANYADTGVSSLNVDAEFARNRLNIIRKCFGLRYYLLATIVNIVNKIIDKYNKHKW